MSGRNTPTSHYYYTAHYDKSQPKKEHHIKIFKSILKIVILVAVIIVAGYFIHTGCNSCGI